MIGEFERPARLRAAQDRALTRYLREQVAAHSPQYRLPLHGATALDGRAMLARLPFSRLVDVVDPPRFVLRPTKETLTSTPERDLRRRYRVADARRRQAEFNREVLARRYKPIHWIEQHDTPIGYTADDIDRLAEIGRSSLEMAGVRFDDVMVAFVEPGPHLAYWQLVFGAREAGVSALFLPPGRSAAAIARLRPNVLAGRAGDLIRLLDEGRDAGLSFAGLHTLIATGEPLDNQTRTRLATLGGAAVGDVAVVAQWAPLGVRALWSECRHGHDVHTWPAAEIIETVDPLSGSDLPPGADGEFVWSPLGWKGTVLMRQRTGVYGSLDDTPCVACGRSSPRLRVVSTLPPFARILDDHAGVELWQAELRTVAGAEELVVFLTPKGKDHPGPLLRELDRQLSVTQFVVLDRRSLMRRLAAHDDARVVDLRS